MTSSLGSSLFSFSVYSASSVAASKNEPVVPSLPRSRPLLHLNRCCFCFHICIFNIDCFASTPGMGALLSLLLLLLHLHSYLSCLRFDTRTAISTVSASTPTLPSPSFCFHLHCHLYTVCFCFQPALPFSTVRLLLTETCHSIFIVSAPTPVLHLYCCCLPKLALPSLLFLTAISTVSDLTRALPSLLFCSHSPERPCLLLLLPHLQFYVHCLCSHSYTSFFTVSASTPKCTSILFLLPNLHSRI